MPQSDVNQPNTAHNQSSMAQNQTVADMQPKSPNSLATGNGSFSPAQF
jgi:hypothetical protein